MGFVGGALAMSGAQHSVWQYCSSAPGPHILFTLLCCFLSLGGGRGAGAGGGRRRDGRMVDVDVVYRANHLVDTYAQYFDES